MRFIPTPIAGMVEVEPSPHGDERGLFARTYDADIFAAAGLHTDWPQCNTSWNRDYGTLRGMHLQRGDAPEVKLVRCTAGRAFDVVLDLRPQSPTFRRWAAVELCATKRNAVYIPAGCAHGFLTLMDGTELFYQMGARYVGGMADGVRWDDPTFDVEWPFAPIVINDRDRSWPDFRG